LNGPDPLAPWDYALPPELIADRPPEARDGGRLLALRGDRCVDATIPDLPSFLEPHDLVVVNDVRVRRARLRARRESGGAVEVMLVRDDEALCRPSRKLAAGERLRCAGGAVTLVGPLGEGRWRVACAPSADALADAGGELPLPPYLGRPADDADDVRYQTVYARAGALAAAAAPTAGLHFTPELLDAVRARGARVASLTLEVGLGTFKPLTEAQLVAGELHPERYVVPEATWAALATARRVVAVGTTVARALESATGPGPGETRIFIRDAWPWRRVDVLFTNLHLPRSSLLALVCSFAGHERVMAGYRHAVEGRSRFFSYGDATLLWRDAATAIAARPE
jgi:S-adenosylmethionine:tRNA ribosyltransferase-isomerase